jgi:hypothetical protein
MENLADLLALAFRSELDMPLLHVPHLRIFLDLGLGAGIVGGGHIEKPSANRLAAPRISRVLVESSAPATPATTANVVTVPSMPP